MGLLLLAVGYREDDPTVGVNDRPSADPAGRGARAFLPSFPMISKGLAGYGPLPTHTHRLTRWVMRIDGATVGWRKAGGWLSAHSGFVLRPGGVVRLGPT